MAVDQHNGGRTPPGRGKGMAGEETGRTDDELRRLQKLNDFVMAYSTEYRIIDGDVAKIIYASPIVRTPATPEMFEMARELIPDPEEMARIKAEVDELASQAYEDQQRYFRELEADGSSVPGDCV